MYRFGLQQQRGIGLLELMLSMVIIAIMTLMSIQYFSSSKMNTQTTKGVDEIQDIVSIVSGFPSLASAIDGGTLNKSVVLSGQLPQEYIGGESTINTPWTGTTFDVKADTTNNVLTISSTDDLPNWACQSLLDKFRAGIDDDGATTDSGCGSGGKTLTLNFQINMITDL